MSKNLNIVPAFDGMNYGYWKARMRFFLKFSLIVGKLLHLVGLNQGMQLSNWFLEETHDLLTIKLSMLFVKHFHRMNLQKFQIVKSLKKHGKS